MLIDYPYIRAYGKLLLWKGIIIDAEIRKAQKADAPSDVVRLLPNGRWTRFNHYDDLWKTRITNNLTEKE
jgi:hypothetical protein